MRWDRADLESLRDHVTWALDTYDYMQPMSAEEKQRFAEQYPGVDMVLGDFKIRKIRQYYTGQACEYPGCAHHIEHPCPGCGRKMAHGHKTI